MSAGMVVLIVALQAAAGGCIFLAGSWWRREASYPGPAWLANYSHALLESWYWPQRQANCAVAALLAGAAYTRRLHHPDPVAAALADVERAHRTMPEWPIA